MKRWESRIVPGGLALAGLVSLFAALKPAFRGSALNVPFLLLGVVCLVGSVAAWKKLDADGTP